MLNVNNHAANLIGLGKGDAVVVYDANGNVAAAMNYGTPTVAAQGGGTTKAIPTATGTNAALVTAGNHAGAISIGGNAKISAVWDTKSTTTPSYVKAAVGVNGGVSHRFSLRRLVRLDSDFPPRWGMSMAKNCPTMSGGFLFAD